MKPGRAFSLLTGVALLGAIAEFNEMTPDAQASLIGAATETARETAQSLLSSAVVTYHEVTDKAMGAAAQPAPLPPAPQRVGAGLTGEGVLPRRAATRTAEAAVEPPSGNPLWALPLKELSATRDRPIFSPLRRPPPPPGPAFVAPVAIQQPAKPPEPEKPAVSLLGTVIGTSDEDRIGVFLETGTQNVVRLRLGEDHQGWVLRLINARNVTMVKDREQAVVLELPPPGDAQSMGGGPGAIPGVPGVPGVASGATPGLPAAYSAAAAAATARQRRPR
jgi:hypothetical protein